MLLLAGVLEICKSFDTLDTPECTQLFHAIISKFRSVNLLLLNITKKMLKINIMQSDPQPPCIILVVSFENYLKNLDMKMSTL